MILKKFFMYILFLLLLIVSVLVIRYVLTKPQPRVKYEDTEFNSYKEDILKQIDNTDSIISNLKYKLDNDGELIKEMDDSLTLQLFYSLSLGK